MTSPATRTSKGSPARRAARHCSCRHAGIRSQGRSGSHRTLSASSTANKQKPLDTARTPSRATRLQRPKPSRWCPPRDLVTTRPSVAQSTRHRLQSVCQVVDLSIDERFARYGQTRAHAPDQVFRSRILTAGRSTGLNKQKGLAQRLTTPGAKPGEALNAAVS